MLANPIVLTVYGIILAAILLVNFLYLFQIFRYRLPGDASLFIVVTHLAIMIFILFIGGIFMNI